MDNMTDESIVHMIFTDWVENCATDEKEKQKAQDLYNKYFPVNQTIDEIPTNVVLEVKIDPFDITVKNGLSETKLQNSVWKQVRKFVAQKKISYEWKAK
tara:strand:- start:2336 stop:2632 length:297 start_codon:yes stop_codon:yes gene_type:complete